MHSNDGRDPADLWRRDLIDRLGMIAREPVALDLDQGHPAPAQRPSGNAHYDSSFERILEDTLRAVERAPRLPDAAAAVWPTPPPARPSPREVETAPMLAPAPPAPNSGRASPSVDAALDAVTSQLVNIQQPPKAGLQIGRIPGHQAAALPELDERLAIVGQHATLETLHSAIASTREPEPPPRRRPNGPLWGLAGAVGVGFGGLIYLMQIDGPLDRLTSRGVSPVVARIAPSASSPSIASVAHAAPVPSSPVAGLKIRSVRTEDTVAAAVPARLPAAAAGPSPAANASADRTGPAGVVSAAPILTGPWATVVEASEPAKEIPRVAAHPTRPPGASALGGPLSAEPTAPMALPPAAPAAPPPAPVFSTPDLKPVPSPPDWLPRPDH